MNGSQVTEMSRANDDVTLLEGESAVEAVLEALDDPNCRAILDATGDDALTASEVAEVCDLPTSTTYRKLDQLAETSLLEERLRLRRSGKHASEYVRAVDDIVVTMGEDGLVVCLSQAGGLERSAYSSPFGALAD